MNRCLSDLHGTAKTVMVHLSMVLLLPALLKAQVLLPSTFPYISPGLSFGWDFSRGMTFGLKVSLGVFHKGGFNNVTLGGTDYLMQKKKGLAQIYIDSHYGFPVGAIGHLYKFDKWFDWLTMSGVFC